MERMTTADTASLMGAKRKIKKWQTKESEG